MGIQEALMLGVCVFFARVADMTLATLRFKFIMRDKKVLVFICAFIEVMVYSIAASYVFDNIDNPIVLIMFSLGFACGSVFGMFLDSKFNKTNVMMQVITKHDDWKLADKIRSLGFGVTTSKGYGLDGAIKEQMLVIVTPKEHNKVMEIIKEHDADAYIVDLDVKQVMRSTVRK